MTFNLLDSSWLPVRRADTSHALIAPWQITQDPANPVVALDAPRPDFNGALAQFLIGLLQTAFAPADLDEWLDRLESPPAPEALQAAFAPFAHAFDLDGDGPRFMQDLDPLEDQKPLPVTALLIDTAGSETHFVKDLPQQGFSPAMAAMALYTLQTNAPSGGVGHRTSLRGGGPLSTLVLAAPQDMDERTVPTLWQTLWLNVLTSDTKIFREAAVEPLPETIFPWLVPTRTSEKGGRETTPLDVHPLQMFWGMPRRIRLDFDNTAGGPCALSGAKSPALVRQYRTRNYGTNYTGFWQHSLSPYNHDPSKQVLTALHPRGSIRYRHWLGLVSRRGDNKKSERIPAAVVGRYDAERLHREGWRYRLWAFGYDMDNMKPRCWHESTFPLFHFDEEARRADFEHAARNLVLAAEEFLNNLRNCLKDAWFAPNDPRRKKANTGFIEDAFWGETEATFYQRLQALAEARDHDLARRAAFDDWYGFLKRYVADAFDRLVNIDLICEQDHVKRVLTARRNLRLFGYNKRLRELLELPAKRKSPSNRSAHAA